MMDKAVEDGYVKALEDLGRLSDIEQAHVAADVLLCLALRECGLERIVAAFDKLTKWYA